MKKESKLMEMLVGYAAAHLHPVNVAVHLVGMPTIMLGVLIPLTWLSYDISAFTTTSVFSINAAQLVVIAFFLFYLTLDSVFAVVFLVLGLVLGEFAVYLGGFGTTTGWIIAAACFFGGYIAQFVGHAIEKSMPVLVKHPIQANLAAPFFTIVELFHITGLRKGLFEDVKAEIEVRRSSA